MAKKKCDSDQILNPATNRCVKKTGAIGKKILENMEQSPKIKKSPTIYKPSYTNNKDEKKRILPFQTKINLISVQEITEKSSFKKNIKKMHPNISNDALKILNKIFIGFIYIISEKIKYYIETFKKNYVILRKKDVEIICKLLFEINVYNDIENDPEVLKIVSFRLIKYLYELKTEIKHVESQAIEYICLIICKILKTINIDDFNNFIDKYYFQNNKCLLNKNELINKIFYKIVIDNY